MKRAMNLSPEKINNMSLNLYNKIKNKYNEQIVIKKYLKTIDNLKK